MRPRPFVGSRIRPVAGLFCAGLLTVGGLLAQTTGAHAAAAAPPYAPRLHVQGNVLRDLRDQRVVLHGVDRSGGEYMCVGNGIWDGPMDQAAITAIRSWNVNAVRVPLNEACWNGESYVNASYRGAAYREP